MDSNVFDELLNELQELSSKDPKPEDQIAKQRQGIKMLQNIENSKTWKYAKRIGSLLDIHARSFLRQFTVDNNLRNDYVYEDDSDYSDCKTDIKPIALYLPQYHAIKENDEWWGKGFTEWTNVRKAQKRYKHHNQPRVPADELGYYDLLDVNVIKKQVEMAKKHGIYAFAFYYYWFSGKRLLEKPIDIFLDHKEIDFPFFFVWANENWTRTWDGKNSNVLIAQEYAEDDAAKFILDIKKYVDDDRYMRVDGKPVICIYSPASIPELEKTVSTWRETAVSIGIGDLCLWYCVTGDISDTSIDHLFDGKYEFPPRGKGKYQLSYANDAGVIFDYRELVNHQNEFTPDDNSIDVFRCSMLQWDNSARKKRKYNMWANYSIDLFYLYNRINVAYSRKYLPEDKRFIFINAWNEWGEGTYLEPDTKYGYSALNALSKAIFDVNCSDIVLDHKSNEARLIGCGSTLPEDTSWKEKYKKNATIALQIHVYYIDLLYELMKCLNNMPFCYDLYISTDDISKKQIIEKYLKKCANINRTDVQVLNNRGRDVIPFLEQMKPVYKNYDFVCHLHTKKSLHNNIGNVWRRYLYNNLLGSRELIEEIIYAFDCDKDLGMMVPETFEEILDMNFGRNISEANKLSKKLGMDVTYTDAECELFFPAGDMFWARTDAVHQMFDLVFDDDSIPLEEGQVDGTMMHAIERMWGELSNHNDYHNQYFRNLYDGFKVLR